MRRFKNHLRIQLSSVFCIVKIFCKWVCKLSFLPPYFSKFSRIFFWFSSRNVFPLFYTCVILLEIQLFLVWNFSNIVNSKALLLKQEYFKNIFRLKFEKNIRIKRHSKNYKERKKCELFVIPAISCFWLLNVFESSAGVSFKPK